MEAVQALRTRRGSHLLARLGSVNVAKGEWREAVNHLTFALKILTASSGEAGLAGEGLSAARLLADLAHAHAGAAGLARAGLGPLGLVALPGAGPAAQPHIAAALAVARAPIQKELIGIGDDDDVFCPFSVGSVSGLTEDEHFEKAEQFYESARGVLEASNLTRASPEGVALLTGLGDFKAARKRWSEALQVYESAQQVLDTWLNETEEKSTDQLTNLPKRQKKYIFGSAAAIKARLLVRIGATLDSLGHVEKALAVQNGAYESFERADMRKSHEAGRLLMTLGIGSLKMAKKADEDRRKAVWQGIQSKADQADYDPAQISVISKEAGMEFVENGVQWGYKALAKLNYARDVFAANDKLYTTYLGIGHLQKALKDYSWAWRSMKRLGDASEVVLKTTENEYLRKRIEALQAKLGIDPDLALKQFNEKKVETKIPEFMKRAIDERWEEKQQQGEVRFLTRNMTFRERRRAIAQNPDLTKSRLQLLKEKNRAKAWKANPVSPWKSKSKGGAGDDKSAGVPQPEMTDF
eukprot:TRINITY_DN22822_c0_g2_i1.p1 TRINITY_DN22822_c0_g2~~TRINITY_DN22822_c0_g2_i1.p1  ORF type:complete len:589 (+),score=110.11 TRINITY_DN22822_c0_g2_i1:194-1768(+)